MLRRIPATQLLEWMHYDAIDPFGQWRADYRAAEIVTMLANINRDGKKKPQPYKTSDFLVQFGEPIEGEKKKKQTWQEQKNIGRLIAFAHSAAGKKRAAQRRPS